MAKAKYNAETFPKLAEDFARDGLNDVEISYKLGISHASFYNYQKKHVEFFEAIKRGKAPVDIDVVNALLKRALGYDYEEKHTEIRIDTSGQPRPAVIKTIKKHIAPDVGACAFWLKNRKPLEWRDKKEIDANITTETIVIDLGQGKDEPNR